MRPPPMGAGARSAQRTARRLPGRPAGRGVDPVLVTGTPTDVCGESSARDAATSGLRVLRIADANAARRGLDHNCDSALHTVHRSFGDVRTTAEVLALTGHGDAPEQGAAVRVRPPRVRPAPGVAFAVPPPVPRATVRTPVLSRSR
ncbi:isochorismatase family protein [Streptomyces sp. NPDC088745]|uniref:isochorismatase family protein n=1 Tax=Streptomyces sp. NPDC088745 TaxID=3365884 RepID=UPI0038282845